MELGRNHKRKDDDPIFEVGDEAPEGEVHQGDLKEESKSELPVATFSFKAPTNTGSPLYSPERNCW